MKNVIGIDIGGTKIEGVVFNGKKVLHELTIAMPHTMYEFERSLIKLVDFLSAKEKISAIGIGMAGLVNPQSGVVAYSPNIKFIKNFNIVKFLQVNGFKNIKVDNDASSFTRAELALGQGKAFHDFLALTLGTGIGGGIVIGKKMYRGKNNSGGELGHAIIGDNFFEEVFQPLRDKKDFKGIGKLVGMASASLINIFAPEAIIIGGGFGRNEAKNYLPYLKKELKSHIFNQKDQTKILITKLKNAGAIGAALLVI